MLEGNSEGLLHDKASFPTLQRRTENRWDSLQYNANQACRPPAAQQSLKPTPLRDAAQLRRWPPRKALVTVRIQVAQSSNEIAACHPIIHELRPHLQEKDFLNTINRLSQTTGFRLAYLIDEDIKAVAGYRISEWLHSGKYLEIEDLITKQTERSKGYGDHLFNWLAAEAKREGCRQLRLVSGVKRTDAHRLYFRKGMVHEANYFSLDL